MAYRLIKGALKLIVALVVLAVLAAGYLFYRAMPAYSGREALAGLSAEVHVWRDDYGIPHIFANDMNDAARALGYLHASERLYQMQMSRWIGQGRIAEIVGPDMLGVDKFLRTLGLYRLAESSVAALSPETQARLQAYADGVNAYLDSHVNALPVEFMLLGVNPEHWKPADFGGLGQADGVGSEPQPRPRNRASAACAKAVGGAGGVADAASLRELAGDDGARGASEPRDVGRSRAKTRPLAPARARRLQPVGGRGLAHYDRQADPRQRPASRDRGAHPLVSCAYRYAEARSSAPPCRACRCSCSATTSRSPGALRPRRPTPRILFVETVDPANPNQYLTPDGPNL